MSFVTRDTFFPALGSTSTVDIPPSVRTGGVTLLLRTRLGSAEVAAQVKREGIQVQAWTNAPVDEARHPGEWGAYTFTAPTAGPSSVQDGDNPALVLDAPEASASEGQHTLFLRLKLRPLPADQTAAEFGVTYRLVYPDGGIWWLGGPGRDARCILRRADPWLASSPAIALGDQADSGTEVFRSISMQEAWGCWAITNERSACPHVYLRALLTEFLRKECNIIVRGRA